MTEESKFGENDSEKERDSGTPTVSTVFPGYNFSQQENETETSPTPPAANLIKSLDKSSAPLSVSRSGKSSNRKEKITCEAFHNISTFSERLLRLCKEGGGEVVEIFNYWNTLAQLTSI